MFRNSYCLVSHSLANVINATRTISFVNKFGSVNVFVFVVKEAFDSPCLPQDYKDEIGEKLNKFTNFNFICIMRTVFFNPDDGKQPKTFGFDLLILQFLTF